ncbi:MAG: glycosyltransferase family 4 protein, partial [Deltaproteobacteria bacterium]|nr:glycosyltransferase family 4 protein [Deltaproteobacteria bacterium]
ARGHQVEVLTGFPNYPGGKIYSGYNIRPWKFELMDDVPVHRLALFPSHDASGVKRILNYLSFGLTAAIFGPFLIKKPDVIYVYNLVTLGLASFILRTLYRCPVVYDIQDLWPDSVMHSGMMKQSTLQGVLNICCQFVYRKASHLTTLSPGFKTELIKRGVPEENISVVYNWCDEKHLSMADKDDAIISKIRGKESFVVLFAGTMGIMQGLDAVLDSAQTLRKIEPKVKFVFVGGGIEKTKLEQSVVHRNLTNVTFIERQPPEKMNTILKAADVLLVHLKDTALFRITIPSKIQAYLFSGKPILMGVQGDSADIIRDSGAGKIVEPENHESITRGILELFRMSDTERFVMGKNGRKYYDKKLSIQAGVSCFENIFRRLSEKCQSPA